MFDTILAPACAWQPPTMATTAKLHPVPCAPKTVVGNSCALRWYHHAEQERWDEAILAYLAENWRGQHEMWSTINTVVAEARPIGRCERRRCATEALHALLKLVRQRRVLRYRKHWVACLEPAHEVVPLDEIPHGKLART